MTAAHTDKALFPRRDFFVVCLHLTLIFLFACAIGIVCISAVVPEFPDDEGRDQPCEQIAHAGKPGNAVGDELQDERHNRHQAAEGKTSMGHCIVFALRQRRLLRWCDLTCEIRYGVGRARDIAVYGSSPRFLRLGRSVRIGGGRRFHIVADDLPMGCRPRRVSPLVDERHRCCVVTAAVRAGQMIAFHRCPFPVCAKKRCPCIIAYNVDVLLQ